MIPTGTTVVLRCDGSDIIGFGHVARCLALAQRLKVVGANCLFAASELPDLVERRLNDRGFPVHRVDADGASDCRQSTELAGRNGVLVTDSHNFTRNYYRAAREGVACLCSFDDIAGGPYASHVVVNPNVGAHRLKIEGCADSQFLLGPSYVPLRPEFDAWISRPNARQSVSRCVISTGGMPEMALVVPLVRVARRLHKAYGIHTTVVAGLSTRPDDLSELSALLDDAGTVITDANMPAVLWSADVAIVNASTTALEAAALGIPVLVVAASDNQDLAANEYRRSGSALVIDQHEPEECAYDLVSQLVSDSDRRRQLSVEGRALVDGQGHMRIIDAMAATLKLTAKED